ncbi:unnamed protein product [Fructobacillus evanidus]|uniref:DUF1700 domain-containing protein n=1 Tax=Fructobacillus evanidus TaxID=3064281 RepID=A0ABN9Z083_9LACO|nr:unnamed protein product [Fructobacillus sp. LMG 32999]
MSEINYYRDKILRYIYLQPEVEVSMSKIQRKFNKITVDEFESLYHEYSDEGLIKLGPKGTINMFTVGAVSDDDPSSQPVSVESKATDRYSTVLLTLKGREIVEHNKKLVMTSWSKMIANPMIAIIISYIIGILTSTPVKAIIRQLLN